MKTHAEKELEKNAWSCNDCGEEADTIYSVNGKKLCERCRKDMLLKKRQQQRVQHDRV